MIRKPVDPAILVVLSGVVAALHIGKMPVAIPALRESLNIGMVEAGFLLAAVQFAGMVAGVLMGSATDSLGLKRSLIGGQLVLAVAGLGAPWLIKRMAYSCFGHLRDSASFCRFSLRQP